MAYGDRYRYLVKTSTGLTPESPYTMVLGEAVPNPFDCFAWRTLAHQLVDKTWSAFVKMGELEDAEVKAGRLLWADSTWNGLNDHVVGLYKKKDEEDLLCATPIDGVPRAVDLALEAVALLDQIDAARERIKPGSVAKPSAPAGGGPTPPGGPPTLVDRIAPWAIGAALLVGVYLLERREARAS